MNGIHANKLCVDSARGRLNQYTTMDDLEDDLNIVMPTYDQFLEEVSKMLKERKKAREAIA